VRDEAHYQPGNPDAAIADFRKTLELQPAQADAALARERLTGLAPAPEPRHLRALPPCRQAAILRPRAGSNRARPGTRHARPPT